MRELSPDLLKDVVGEGAILLGVLVVLLAIVAIIRIIQGREP